MPEGESVQATGVNWDAARYEVTFFVLYTVGTIAQIRWFRAPLLRGDWATFGRQLAIVFVAALLAGLTSGVEGVGVLGISVLALLRVAIFTALLGHVFAWVRFRRWRRGRST